MNKYLALGIMSGTSLDGVDIALCEFHLKKNNKWTYNIQHAKTYKYDNIWREKLINAHTLDAFGIIKLHKDYGHYLGGLVNNFIKSNIAVRKNEIDFIASHGHTIFHQPDKGVTFQAGDGANIAAISGITVISDFRSIDVALGGQGAPLVPIGDKLLFSDYDCCINLGGFANISYNEAGKRIGFDICPCNIILNMLAHKAGFNFDDKGKLASAGEINDELLNDLYSVFNENKPLSERVSLSREWLENNFLPVLNKYDISIPDQLRTITELIARRVANSLSNCKASGNMSTPLIKILITGGGAYNDFLISLIKHKTCNQITIPDKYTIDFKEALIFAFLGVLRSRIQINCLKSVTGASADNIGGAIYTPF